MLHPRELPALLIIASAHDGARTPLHQPRRLDDGITLRVVARHANRQAARESENAVRRVSPVSKMNFMYSDDHHMIQ